MRCPVAAVISRSPALRISEAGSRRTARGYASWTATTSASGHPQPAQLPVEVGPRAALAAALGDRVAELEQARLDDVALRLPAPALALVEPGGGGGVAAGAILAAAGGDLVLGPRGAALEPRDDVLERGLGEAGYERPPAPDAVPPVALEDQAEALRPRQTRV